MKSDEAYAKMYVTKGLKFTKQGAHKKALRAYKKAKLLDPKNAWAWTNTGYSYFQLRDLDKALLNYLEAVKIDPQNWQAWINLAVACETDAKFDAALKAYGQARKINPKNAWAWHGAGLMYYYLGDSEKAISYLKEAVRRKLGIKKIRETLQIVTGQRDIRSPILHFKRWSNPLLLGKIKKLIENSIPDKCLYCGSNVKEGENQEFVCAQKLRKHIWLINYKLPYQAKGDTKSMQSVEVTKYHQSLSDYLCSTKGDLFYYTTKSNEMKLLRDMVRVMKFSADFMIPLKGTLCKDCSNKFLPSAKELFNDLKIGKWAKEIDHSVTSIYKNYYKLVSLWVDKASERLNIK